MVEWYKAPNESTKCILSICIKVGENNAKVNEFHMYRKKAQQQIHKFISIEGGGYNECINSFV